MIKDVLDKLIDDVVDAWDLGTADLVYSTAPQDEAPVPYAVIDLDPPEFAFQTSESDEMTLSGTIWGTFATPTTGRLIQAKADRVDTLRQRITDSPDYAGAYLPIVTGADWDQQPPDERVYTVGVRFQMRLTAPRGVPPPPPSP